MTVTILNRKVLYYESISVCKLFQRVSETFILGVGFKLEKSCSRARVQIK